MKCPVCGTWTRVLDTRDTDELFLKRRRECGNHHRFFTFEVHDSVFSAAMPRFPKSWRRINADIARWQRDRDIWRDQRPGAVIAREYGLTRQRVNAIKREQDAIN
jgi:transcriptional regulator NrdR family protein